jgi:hypothetical protein
VLAEPRHCELGARIARLVRAAQWDDRLIRAIGVHHMHRLHKPAVRRAWRRDENRRYVLLEAYGQHELFYELAFYKSCFVYNLQHTCVTTFILTDKKKSKKIKTRETLLALCTPHTHS